MYIGGSIVQHNMYQGRNSNEYPKVGSENILKKGDYKNIEVVIEKSLTWISDKMINQNKVPLNQHTRKVLKAVEEDLKIAKGNKVRPAMIKRLESVVINLNKIVNNRSAIILNKNQRQKDEVYIDFDSILESVRDMIENCCRHYRGKLNMNN